MKFTRHILFILAVLTVTISLTAAIWYGTTRAVREQQDQVRARAEAVLSGEATTLREQISRQLQVLDQTLRLLASDWQTNPRAFDLDALRRQAVALTGLSRDMVLTDGNGLIRQCSANEAVNQSAAGFDYFRALSEPDAGGDGLFIGTASIDPIMRQWHMNVARALHAPDGSFAGVIATDYRISAISDAFAQSGLGASGFLALVGAEDGRVRAAIGPTNIDPDTNIVDSAMFRAMAPIGDGVWTGPSPSDAIRRIHVFRAIPGRNLRLVVAVSEADAMAPATIYRQDANAYAGFITVLLGLAAVILIQGSRRGRRRDRQMLADRAMLAASNAQLEVARAEAAAKAERLTATLSGMADGVSMIDAHLCLVEWNDKFPELAGVPTDILHVGLPMEEMLHAQVASGQFGRIADPLAEVQRRIARIRVAPFGVTQRMRPDGRVLELRRNRLPDGGFVTLYSDVTDRRHAEEALRQARAEAEAANAARSSFMAMVSHEIRTPLNALLNAIRLLSDSKLNAGQQSLVALARQSGDALFGLITDVLEMTRAEAGKIVIRPSLFELRPLLESSAEMMAVPAAERGISFRVVVAPEVPALLCTDPSRLRQILLNLLSNAAKYAGPGVVTVHAEMPPNPDQPLRLSVRDQGPLIPDAARALLFRPFARLDRPADADTGGSGLGLSICRHLITLMGGSIGCDVWCDGATEGNTFWLTLPAAALDAGSAPTTETPQDYAETQAGRQAAAAVPVPRRRLPRTRILLVEDVPANQIVTATLLRRDGHSVDIAGDGQAAVAAVQTRPYDLVFMDIYMPGMSGIEATQIIRSLPGPARSMPIIALTADVDADDAALYRRAGMDGHLGKPVALSAMLDTIMKHVWWPDAALSRLTPRPADSKAAATTMAVLSVERIEELRSNLPPRVFAELVEECISDLDLRLPALRRALAAGVPGAITAHAHTMAGLAASYGMEALEARLRAVLDAARENALGGLEPGMMQEIEADLSEAKGMLREIAYKDFDPLPQITG